MLRSAFLLVAATIVSVAILPAVVTASPPNSETLTSRASAVDEAKDCGECEDTLGPVYTHWFDGGFGSWFCGTIGGGEQRGTPLSFATLASNVGLAWRARPSTLAGGSEDCYNCEGGGCHSAQAPATCSSSHPYCPVVGGGDATRAVAEVEQYTASQSTIDMKSVAELIVRYPENFYLNIERSALQIVDCQGRIAGHLPVKLSFDLVLAVRHSAYRSEDRRG